MLAYVNISISLITSAFCFSLEGGGLRPRGGQRRRGALRVPGLQGRPARQLRLLGRQAAQGPQVRLDLGRLRGQHRVWIQVRNQTKAKSNLVH